MYDWTPPEGVDRRVHLRSLLPTIEVNGKRYLEGGRLGVVQEEATDVAAAVAASSSAEEGEAMCNMRQWQCIYAESLYGMHLA